MDEIYLPTLPNTDYILEPPSTIFYPPIVQEPYLDPILLPSLDQVQSGLQEDRASSVEEDKTSSEVIESQLEKEIIPQNLPAPKETLSSETVATFNLPFFGEMPIPAPEVIASSVISAGAASIVTVTGSIAMQAVVAQIKKIFKKIFTKILKKEVANVKEKIDNKKGS